MAVYMFIQVLDTNITIINNIFWYHQESFLDDTKSLFLGGMRDMKKKVTYGVSSIFLLVVFYFLVKGSIDWVVIIALIYFNLFSYLFNLLKSRLSFFLLNVLVNALFFYLQDTDLSDLTGTVLFALVFSIITYAIFWFVNVGAEKEIK